jgi:predicted TIM-barrel fold metal-dependent hydrolase
LIVDMHTHLWQGDTHAEERQFSASGRVPEATLEAYFQGIEAADRAVLLALASDGYRLSNEVVGWVVEHAPERVVGFASVNPGSPGAADELARAVEHYGLRGLKIAPIYQHFAPDDPAVFGVYERALALGLPIMIHQGTSYAGRMGALEDCTPVRLDRVAREYPELKIVIAHLGYPWGGEVVALLRKHPNIYADCSALSYRPWFLFNTLVHAMEYGALGKVLFGSDYPDCTSQTMREVVMSLANMTEGTNLPHLPREQLQALVERDSLRMLGISA